MTIQFDRVAKLIIGKGGNGLVIENLRITFSIKKSSDSKANEAKIEVYNLNPEHRGKLLKEWQDIFLMVGYRGNERMIFTGQVRRAFVKSQGTDRIVVIESGDGDKAILQGTVNKTFTAGCTDSQIVGECLSGMGNVPVGHSDNLNDKGHARGKTVSGKASDVLTKTTTANEAQWSIQDGQLVLLKGKNLRPNAVFLINNETGLLASPEQTEKGIKAKTLLNPAYLIGGLAKIESEAYKGGIRIEKITHSGDTHGQDWSSELEGLLA